MEVTKAEHCCGRSAREAKPVKGFSRQREYEHASGVKEALGGGTAVVVCCAVLSCLLGRVIL